MAERDKCRIVRTGTVRRVDEESAVVEVDGKPVAVPVSKLEAGVKAGDEVTWTGGKWRVSVL